MGELEEQLEASNAMFVENCEGSRYGVMCTYHDLEALSEVWTFGGPVREQIDFALFGPAAGDHRRHEERGTCVESEPPTNKRTKQWKG